MIGVKMESSGNGIGFGTVLGIVFIVLKLTGVIHWAWVWVLAPIWIPASIMVLVVLATLIYSFFAD